MISVSVPVSLLFAIISQVQPLHTVEDSLTIEALHYRLQKLEERLQTCECENNEEHGRQRVQSFAKGYQTSVTGMYAFTAVLNDTTKVYIGQDIIFDTVLLNIGNAYNVRDGIFASNYTGVYMFTWNLFTNGDVGAQLKVNGIPVVESYVEIGRGYYNVHGSVIIRLNAGDYVVLGCDEKGGPLIQKKTTFTGLLISP